MRFPLNSLSLSLTMYQGMDDGGAIQNSNIGKHTCSGMCANYCQSSISLHFPERCYARRASFLVAAFGDPDSMLFNSNGTNLPPFPPPSCFKPGNMPKSVNARPCYHVQRRPSLCDLKASSTSTLANHGPLEVERSNHAGYITLLTLSR